ncbi:hypothetical protein F503_04160 [Ophiostoma piceae UAMH 11346]|uniref:Secreted protein n=1 Tax=Ophiostoma piceae (strain UAMH 11346) TaxID=1262450 RepID=S3CPS2_OPHP1|nr:hypothetical protein F503_04160 [Ophiostoma piceae UAMH 11346]
MLLLVAVFVSLFVASCLGLEVAVLHANLAAGFASPRLSTLHHTILRNGEAWSTWPAWPTYARYDGGNAAWQPHRRHRRTRPPEQKDLPPLPR